MADNVSVNEGTGTTVAVAADEIAGVKHQRVKIQHGADGSATDVSTASPLPVSDAGGTLSIDDGGGSITVDGTFWQATQPVSGTVSLTDISAAEYETVAASQTDQALGATGATGDYLSGVLIVPATTSPGAVSIKDGAGSAITVFTGGASSVSNLVPFFVPLGIKSTGGAWKVTTGSNVSAIGVGNFT